LTVKKRCARWLLLNRVRLHTMRRYAADMF
jgi:hypothetical protein